MEKRFWNMMMAMTMLCCLLGFWSFNALADEEESALSVGIEVDYASKYIWRGFNLYGDSNPGVQPSAYLEYAVNDELSVGYSIWGSYNVDESDLDEVDHELYLNYALNDSVGLELGYILYRYPSASAYNTEEIYVGASLSLNDFFTASFKVNFDTDEADGYYANLKLEGEYPLNDIFTLNGSAALGYMNYDNDYYVEGGISDFSDLSLILGVSADFGNGFSSFATLNYSVSLADEVNEDNEAWVVAGLAYDF